MYSISGVAVVYNESKIIYHMLESLQRVCNEILISDSYSTDNTASICESYGATIYQNEFKNHRDNKNFIIEKATLPWVLILDADEQLSNLLADNIQTIITLAEENGIDAIGVPRFNILDGEGPRGFPDWQIRLFKNYVRHIGEPFHHTNTGNSKKQIYLDKYGYILHIKDMQRQIKQNQLYWNFRPQDYKTLPDGVTSDMKPIGGDSNNPNVYRDLIINAKNI